MIIQQDKANQAFKRYFSLKTCNIELMHIKSTNQHILTCERLLSFFKNLILGCF